MKDSKNVKNRNNEKLDEQTPSPAVPNRAHTEMSTSEKRADNTQSKSSSKASDTLKKQSTKWTYAEAANAASAFFTINPS